MVVEISAVVGLVCGVGGDVKLTTVSRPKSDDQSALRINASRVFFVCLVVVVVEGL